MDLPQNSILSNIKNSSPETNFFNKKSVGANLGIKMNNNTSVYYAKKGEPMYMKEMDTDEDGIISLDEFKDYCQENGISSREMIKMVQMANSYRTMQSDKRAEKSIKQKSSNDNVQEIEKEAIYAKRGDAKYEEVMDTNNDDKVSYKEYIEYCKEHAARQNKKNKTTVNKSNEDEFKTINAGKAINSYIRSEQIADGIVNDDA